MTLYVVAEVMTALWFFFFGAALGSFLNVVLWRLPRGQKLLWPPSACPVCAHRLRLKDNLPVVGWLMLRGKCRYCQVKISFNYLWIEIFCGLITLMLVYVIVLSGGSTLPLRSPNSYGGAMWTILYPKYDLLQIYFYFLSLVLAQFMLIMFVLRGNHLPLRIILIAFVIALGFPLLGLPVQQVPWDGAIEKVKFRYGLGIADASLGLLAGAILGYCCQLILQVNTTTISSPMSSWWCPTSSLIVLLLSLAGAHLGWQAVISVGLLASIILCLLPAGAPLSVCILIATLVQLILWRMLTEYVSWWPGVYLSLPMAALYSCLPLLLIWFSCFLKNFINQSKTASCQKGNKANEDTPGAGTDL